MAQRNGRPASNRTCDIDGCEAKHLARGLCRKHYKRTHETHDSVCATCGEMFRGHRATAKFCSDQCKGDAYRTRTVSLLPRAHPVTELIRQEMYEAKRSILLVVDCEWCGTQVETRKMRQRFCSFDCKRHAMRVRRRGREHGAMGTYTWTEVVKVYLRLGRCCAYCEQPIDGQPDPDHVVPLSRGGSNSITNILPSCRPCNSDKRDLLLDEWAVDRERRGLPAVTTTWALDDPRVRHLTCLATAA